MTMPGRHAHTKAGGQDRHRRTPGRVRPSRVCALPERREAGDTLLEVLFALVILSIASVALLVAFATSISASAVHRSAATFDTVIRSAAQQAEAQIQTQTNPLYESCAPLSYYQTAQSSGGGAPSFDLPTGYTAQVTQVQYWNGTTFVSSSTAPPCVANSPEWITLQISNGSQSYTNNFIVDDPFAPPVPAAGPAYQLVFAVQPAGAIAGQPFTTQPLTSRRSR
jgi:type II secretory pathway pseudopilin PulG